VNSLRMKSIGGELLGKAEPEKPGESDKVLLASHRYGRGKCAVMAVADTWQWQMRKELSDPYQVPSSFERHHRQAPPSMPGKPAGKSPRR